MQESPAHAPLWTRGFVQAGLHNFFVFASMMMLTPTVPLFVLHLGGSEQDIGLVVGAFGVTAGAVRLVVGNMLDRVGVRPVLIGSVGLFSVACVVHAAIAAIPVLIIGRLLLGLGWGAAIPAAGVLVAGMVPRQRRGEGFGFFSIFTNLAAAAAPALGLLVVELSGFPALFVVAGLSAAVATVLALGLPASKPDPRFELPGNGAQLFPNGIVWPCGVNFFVTLAQGAVLAFVTVHALEQRLGNPALFFVAFSGAVLLTRPILGGLSDRRARAGVLLPALICIALSLVLLAHALDQYGLILGALLYGLGWSASQPTLQATVIDLVPSSRFGAAMTAFHLSWDAGHSIGAFIAGLAAHQFGTGSVFVMSSVCVALGLALAIWSRVGRAESTARQIGGS